MEWFRSLRVKLVITFILMVVAPLSIVTIYTIYSLNSGMNETSDDLHKSFDTLENQVGSNVTSLSRGLLEKSASETDVIITNLGKQATGITKQIVANPQLFSGDVSDSEELMGKLIQGFDSVSYAYIGRQATKEFVIAPRPEGLPADYDPTGTDWYKDAVALPKGETLVTDAYLASDGSEYMVTVATPIYDGDKLLGVIGVDAVLGSLGELVSDIKVPTNGSIIVSDSKGTILAHTISENVGKSVVDLGIAKPVEDGGVVISSKDYEIYSMTNKSSKWTVSSIQPLKDFNEVSTILTKNLATTEGVIEDSQESMSKGMITFSTILLLVLTLVGALVGYIIARKITKPIEEMASVADRVAKGDLSQGISNLGNDEVFVLGTALNNMVQSLRKMVGGLTTITKEVDETSHIMEEQMAESNATAESINYSMTELAHGSTSLTNNMVAVSETLENMTGLMDNFVTDITNVNTEMHKASNYSKNGLDSLENVNKQMQEIENQSSVSITSIGELMVLLSKVKTIADMIHGLAEKSNLLALNASIEAARVGEAGRGFAVVAGEVRDLAEQSKDSVKSIKSLVALIEEKSDIAVNSIHSNDKGIKEGLEIIEGVNEAFNAILSSVNTLTTDLDGVLKTSKNLKDGANTINQSVSEVVAVSEETTASTDEVKYALESQLDSNTKLMNVSTSLKSLATDLKQEVNGFNL